VSLEARFRLIIKPHLHRGYIKSLEGIIISRNQALLLDCIQHCQYYYVVSAWKLQFPTPSRNNDDSTLPQHKWTMGRSRSAAAPAAGLHEQMIKTAGDARGGKAPRERPEANSRHAWCMIRRHSNSATPLPNVSKRCVLDNSCLDRFQARCQWKRTRGFIVPP
jgi:hypothetical protein